MKDDYKDVKKQLSKKISESTKLYNRILHVYNASIGKDFDSRRSNTIINLMQYDIISEGGWYKLFHEMRKSRIRYMMDEIRIHKKHAPAALRQLKYEIRRLQRELSNYI